MVRAYSLSVLAALHVLGVLNVAAAEVEARSDSSELPGKVELPPIPESGERWMPGIHYTVLIPPGRSEAAAGKVEVVELFMYTSPLSKQVQPHVRKWLKTKADYIEYRREPSIVFPHARLQARMYLTLQAIGREDLHERLFEWVFDSKHYPTYHTIMHPDEAGYTRLNREFAKANGIDERKFLAVYESKEMTDKIAEAELATHSYHVRGTSTFVVNGKYSTSVQRISYPKGEIGDEDFDRLFRLIDYLATSEVNRPSSKQAGHVKEDINYHRIVTYRWK